MATQETGPRFAYLSLPFEASENEIDSCFAGFHLSANDTAILIDARGNSGEDKRFWANVMGHAAVICRKTTKPCLIVGINGADTLIEKMRNSEPERALVDARLRMIVSDMKRPMTEYFPLKVFPEDAEFEALMTRLIKGECTEEEANAIIGKQWKFEKALELWVRRSKDSDGRKMLRAAVGPENIVEQLMIQAGKEIAQRAMLPTEKGGARHGGKWRTLSGLHVDGWIETARLVQTRDFAEWLSWVLSMALFYERPDVLVTASRCGRLLARGVTEFLPHVGTVHFKEYNVGACNPEEDLRYGSSRGKRAVILEDLIHTMKQTRTIQRWIQRQGWSLRRVIAILMDSALKKKELDGIPITPLGYVSITASHESADVGSIDPRTGAPSTPHKTDKYDIGEPLIPAQDVWNILESCRAIVRGHFMSRRHHHEYYIHPVTVLTHKQQGPVLLDRFAAGIKVALQKLQVRPESALMVYPSESCAGVVAKDLCKAIGIVYEPLCARPAVRAGAPVYVVPTLYGTEKVEAIVVFDDGANTGATLESILQNLVLAGVKKAVLAIWVNRMGDLRTRDLLRWNAWRDEQQEGAGCRIEIVQGTALSLPVYEGSDCPLCRREEIVRSLLARYVTERLRRGLSRTRELIERRTVEHNPGQRDGEVFVERFVQDELMCREARRWAEASHSIEQKYLADNVALLEEVVAWMQQEETCPATDYQTRAKLAAVFKKYTELAVLSESEEIKLTQVALEVLGNAAWEDARNQAVRFLAKWALDKLMDHMEELIAVLAQHESLYADFVESIATWRPTPRELRRLRSHLDEHLVAEESEARVPSRRRRHSEPDSKLVAADLRQDLNAILPEIKDVKLHRMLQALHDQVLPGKSAHSPRYHELKRIVLGRISDALAKEPTHSEVKALIAKAIAGWKFCRSDFIGIARALKALAVHLGEEAVGGLQDCLPNVGELDSLIDRIDTTLADVAEMHRRRYRPSDLTDALRKSEDALRALETKLFDPGSALQSFLMRCITDALEVAEEIAQTLTALKVDFSWPVQKNIATKCWIPQGLLRSVIENIYQNALTHGRATKVDVNILPDSDFEDEDYLLLYFKDNGAGISREALEQVRRGACTLGLQKETLLMWGGNISVDTVPSTGTVVKVKLAAVQRRIVS